MFYRWQIIEKKIIKSKVDVTFKDAAEMFKDDINTLKENIYIKRRQANVYHEIKASFSENDLMLHVDFVESYKNDQQDAIQSAYFGNQYIKIFTACCHKQCVMESSETKSQKSSKNSRTNFKVSSKKRNLIPLYTHFQKFITMKKNHMNKKTYF